MWVMGGELLGGPAGGDGIVGDDGTLWGLWPSSGGWVGNYASNIQDT